MSSRNVEIKARLADAGVQRRLAARLADSGPIRIRQRDVFFNCPHGRLKLRYLDDGSGQLIYYERPDREAPATSHYDIFPTPDPARLQRLLESAWGVRAVVAKTRELYRAGRTRIHLDRVEGLGEFLELEVVLAAGESEAAGRAEAERLMAQLEITRENLLDRAYVDLLEDARSASGG